MKIIVVILFYFININILYSTPTWIKSFGGDNRDKGVSIILNNDSTFLIVGSTYSFSSNISKGLLIKMNTNGEVKWDKIYGENNGTFLSSIIKHTAESYLLGGYTVPDSNNNGMWKALLIYVNNSGDTIWTKNYGDTGRNYITSLTNDQNGNIIFPMCTKNEGLPETMKLYVVDSNGNTKNIIDCGEKIIQSIITLENGYIIAGYKHSPEFIYSGFIEKLDINFNTKWNKSYNESDDAEILYDIIKSDDDSYIAVGWANIPVAGNSDCNALIMKIDLNGEKIWTKLLNENINSEQIASIIKVSNDEFVFCGAENVTVPYNSDAKGLYGSIDINGNILWEKRINYSINEYDFLMSLVGLNNNEGIILVGYSGDTEFLTGNTDIIIVKTDLDGNYNSINENLNSYKLSQNYPNPFNPTTTIKFVLPKISNVKLQIFNTKGELVKTLLNNKNMKAGLHKVDFNGSKLSSGIYYYHIKTDNFNTYKRMLLLK